MGTDMGSYDAAEFVDLRGLDSMFRRFDASGLGIPIGGSEESVTKEEEGSPSYSVCSSGE